MTTIKGPGIFLAQFMGDKPPYNNLQAICSWAEELGYKAVQIPTWDSRCIDLQKAAESKTYADEIKGIVNDSGLEISELSTHLQGQLVAVHPAYDTLFDGFAPEALTGKSKSKNGMGSTASKIWCKSFAKFRINCTSNISAVLYYGILFIPGRNDLPVWWKKGLKNWENDGHQS